MAKRTALILGCAILVGSGLANAQKSKAIPATKSWAAEPSAFFGIPLGVEIKQTDIGNCGQPSPNANPTIAVCARGGTEKLVSIGGFPIKEIESGYIAFHEDVVSVVQSRLAHRDHQKIRALLIQRYGNPTSTDLGTVQNGMGAAFNNEVLTWRGEHVTLTLTERDGKVDQSGITILHNKTVERAVAKEGQKRQSEAAKF